MYTHPLRTVGSVAAADVTAHGDLLSFRKTGGGRGAPSILPRLIFQPLFINVLYKKRMEIKSRLYGEPTQNTYKKSLHIFKAWDDGE